MEENIFENLISEKTSCTICLNDDLSDEITYRTNCSHIFCKQCIEDWFKRGNDSCPLCRGKVTHYESEGTQYRLIIRNSSNINSNQSLLIRNSLYQVRRLSILNYRLKNLSFFMILMFILMYQIFLSYIDQVDVLSDNYNICIHNVTRLTNNLEMCLDELYNPDNPEDDGTYVNILFGNGLKTCFYPYIYLSQCLSE